MQPGFKHHFDPPIGREDFFVHSYGCSTSPGAHFEPRHPVEETWLFCHFYDPVTIRVNERLDAQPAQTWIFWEPGQRRGYGNASLPWWHSFLHLSGSRVAQVCAGGRNRAGVPSTANGAEPLTERFLRDLDREARHELSPNARILGNLFEIWFLGMHRFGAKEDRRMSERLIRVRDKIIDGSAAWQSLSELAHMAAMSKSHFSACFHEAFGSPPGALQKWWRIERAKSLLSRPDMRISDVAEHLGFADAFGFSRSFKDVTGTSPRAWRLKAKEAEEAAG